jgi:hypothetical protein
LLIVSIMWTGIRIVRAWSAIAPGDRLPDPPGGVGREFVAAAIFELIDRLHEADIALLDEVQELKAAIGVFLGDRDDEAEVGLDHLLLGDARLALGLLDLVHDAAEFGQAHAGGLRDLADLAADALDRLAFGGAEGVPLAVGAAHALGPAFVQLVAHIGVEEGAARNLVALGQAQHLAAERVQARL